MKENFIHCNKKEVADFLVEEFGCVVINSYKNGDNEMFILSNEIKGSKFEKLDFSVVNFSKKDLIFTNKMMF